MIFEWDEKKAAANIAKHGISFERAIQVFADNSRIVRVDDRFAYGEERLITIGHLEERLCVVVYVERLETTIRIISARKANKREIKEYGNR
ncbi:MAG: BrnT family toxin [Symploca sp. SIO3E6]|nr:BrnT family toxin [Caldora sp. SIO3E6]